MRVTVRNTELVDDGIRYQLVHEDAHGARTVIKYEDGRPAHNLTFATAMAQRNAWNRSYFSQGRAIITLDQKHCAQRMRRV